MGAEVPLWMRCICSGMVILISPLALHDSHRGVGGGGVLVVGAAGWWWCGGVVLGCTRVFWKGGFGAVGLWGFGLEGGPLLLWACASCV